MWHKVSNGICFKKDVSFVNFKEFILKLQGSYMWITCNSDRVFTSR